MDGLDVCRTLRRESRVPIIMVTARDDEVDRVVGLEIGADDYVTKPFSVRELMARVRATLRRVEIEQEAGPSSTPSNEVLRKGPLEIDLSAHSVRVAGVPLDLTRQAFDLLATLARHQGQALSREQLLNHVWGYDYYGDNRAVDSAIKRLRAELADAGLASDLIATVRGVGYRFDWDA
jgi:two-component system response regulator VicR